ncbi:hypothetical protein SCUP515_03763 [Seiridium cupressi]
MADPFSSQEGWARPSEWEDYKNTIFSLYCENDKPLKEVVDIMRNEHNFHGSKNLTAKESQELQHQLTMGRQTVLPTRHGYELGSKRLKSYIDKTNKSLRAPGKSTRGYTKVLEAPVPRVVKAPDSLYIPEDVLHTVVPITAGVFETWWCGIDSNEHQNKTRAWGNEMQLAAYKIGQGRDLAANFQILNKCCDQYRSLLRGQGGSGGDSARLLTWVTYVAVLLLSKSGIYLAMSFVRYIAELCGIELGREHLLTKLWNNVSRMDVSLPQEPIVHLIETQLAAMWEKIVNEEVVVTHSTVATTVLLIHELSTEECDERSCCHLEKLEDGMQRIGRTFPKGYRLSGVHLSQARLIVTTMLGGRVKHGWTGYMVRMAEKWYRKDECPDISVLGAYDRSIITDYHQMRAEMDGALGRYDSAEACFRAALDVAAQLKASDMNLLLWVCSSFEDFYRQRGNTDAAESTRKRYLVELQACVTGVPQVL